MMHTRARWIGLLTASLGALGCSGSTRSGNASGDSPAMGGSAAAGISGSAPQAGTPGGSEVGTPFHSGGSGGAAPLGGAPAVDDPVQGAGELAKPADSFVDMIGVNGHLNYEGSAYAEHFDAVLARVQELGIRHWRDALNVSPPVLERQKALGALGVHFNLIVQELDVDVVLAAAKQSLGVATSIEGPNELDHGFRNGLPAFPDASTRTYQGVGFPGIVPAFQNDLYAAIKGDPETQGLQVLMAGFSFPDNTLDVGLVEGCDCGNTHSYPDGGLPTFRLDDWYIPRMKVSSGPDKPLCATETGYHNTPMPDGSHWIPPVSERASSKYDPRLFFEYFNRGFQRVYLYEFADVSQSSQAADLNFGLLKSDGAPKAQFISLKALLGLLSDPGPAFTPARLDYTLTGGVPELMHTLLQKRDGTFYLVLWLDSLSFDRDTKQDLDSSCGVHLSLRKPVTNVDVYQPVEAATAVASLGASQELDLVVPDQPLVLEIKP